MDKRLSIAFIGNIIDAIATVILCGKGFVELNAAMAFLLQWPILFLIVKLTLGSGVVYYLSRQERDRNWEIAATVAAVIYGALGLYYIIWFLIMIL